VARTLGATPAQHFRSFFSRDPARALAALPAGFVLGGDVPGTGVPILRKAIVPGTSPQRLDNRTRGVT